MVVNQHVPMVGLRQFRVIEDVYTRTNDGQTIVYALRGHKAVYLQ